MRLAYTVDAADRLGNGIYLLDPETGETHALNTAAADFEQLAWSGEGTNLAVLRGDKVKDMKQKENVLLAWSALGAANAKPFVFEPSKDASFPKTMVLSEFTAPRWSKDGSRVFIGIKEQEPEIPEADAIKAERGHLALEGSNAAVVQIVQLQQLRQATLPAVVFVSTGKFVKLGDDEMRTVTMAASSNVGVGRNDAAYRGEVAWGGSRADLYKVDIDTGARTLIEKALSRMYGTSPDSKVVSVSQEQAGACLQPRNRQLRAAGCDGGSRQELRERGRRPRIREAHLGRRRLVERWKSVLYMTSSMCGRRRSTARKQ